MRTGPAALALAAGVALLFLLPAAAAKATLVADDRPGFRHNRYEPDQLIVAPGEAVEVRDAGEDSHTVTPVQAGAWSDVVLNPGEAKGFTAPAAAGEYKFFCRFHASPQAELGQGMVGVLRVREGGATPPAPPGAGGSATPVGAEAIPLAVLAAAFLARARGRRMQEGL